MKMFSDCSGPCETCKVHVSGSMCLAGHGDDDYSYADAEWTAALEKQQANRKYARWVKARHRNTGEV